MARTTQILVYPIHVAAVLTFLRESAIETTIVRAPYTPEERTALAQEFGFTPEDILAEEAQEFGLVYVPDYYGVDVDSVEVRVPPAQVDAVLTFMRRLEGASR